MEIERFGAADRGWARDALALACRLHAAHRRQREPYARPGRLHDRSRPGHGRAAGPSRQKAPGGPPGLSSPAVIWRPLQSLQVGQRDGISRTADSTSTTWQNPKRPTCLPRPKPQQAPRRSGRSRSRSPPMRNWRRCARVAATRRPDQWTMSCVSAAGAACRAMSCVLCWQLFNPQLPGISS